MEIVDNKVVLLRTNNPDKYAVIPKSRYVGELSPGTHQVAVYWGPEEVQVLRNLGVKGVPSPIMGAYDWPGMFTPFSHQRDTAAFLTLNNRAFCFNEPGTGKTSAALWAADFLMKRKLARRCLIVCPLSIMRSAWLADIVKTVIHRTVAVAYHNDAQRRKEIILSNYEFVIVNYDALHIVADVVNRDGRFDIVIADEATAVKNVTTRRWKALSKVVPANGYLWLMTGTPAAQSPLDAYGLARLVNPGGVPAYSTAWRDMVMRQITKFKWVPKATAVDRVFEALQPAIRFTKAECLDLPPVLTETREVPLTAQQHKYYRILKERLLVEAAGATISVINAAAGVNKLLQVSAGAAYSDNHEVVQFDCTPRLHVLLEVLNETDRKVIVFAHFRHSIDTIHEFLEKQRITSDQVHGDVPPNRRTEIFNKFQTTPDPRVLILQPQAAAHGVTLTAADTVVFWSPIPSVENYVQSIARADRIGQTSNSVTVVHLEGSPIEKKMYKVLAERIEDHTSLIDLYKEELTAA